MASIISTSAFPELKLDIIIRFSTRAGKIQNIVADSWLLKIAVSLNVLHKINEATLGQFEVYSANFWAR